MVRTQGLRERSVRGGQVEKLARPSAIHALEVRQRGRLERQLPLAYGEVSRARARQRLLRGGRSAPPLELPGYGVHHLLGDGAVCGDLAPDNGDDSGYPLASLVVEQRVLARALPFRDTLLAHEGAHACPGEVDVIERRLRERVARLGLQVADVILVRGRVRGIADIVRICGTDDRRVEPGQYEEEAAIALREEHMRVLRGASRNEVDAFRQPKQPLLCAAH